MLFNRGYVGTEGIVINDFKVMGQSELTETLSLHQLIDLVDNQTYLSQGHEELIPLTFEAGRELAMAKYQSWQYFA